MPELSAAAGSAPTVKNPAKAMSMVTRRATKRPRAVMSANLHRPCSRGARFAPFDRIAEPTLTVGQRPTSSTSAAGPSGSGSCLYDTSPRVRSCSELRVRRRLGCWWHTLMVANESHLREWWSRRWPLAALLVLLVVALGMVVLWVFAPALYTGSGARPDAQAAATATTRAGILAVFAATIAALGAAAALAETRHANRKTHERFREEQEAANTRFREEQDAERTHFREAQATDRYTKAVGQLGEAGDENLVARLGGIYALRRIAEDFPRDQRTIVQVLCAFVRHRGPPPVNESADGDKAHWPPIDVQAAITVIGRRDPSHDDLERVGPKDEEDEYNRLVDLFGAHLEHAHMPGVHLEKADLEGAHLEDAELFVAHLEEADLRRAHFERARMNAAHLEGADLRGAHLEDLATAFRARFDGAKLLGAFVERANLRRASLSHAWLAGANLDNADLSAANLVGARFAASLTSVGAAAAWSMWSPHTSLVPTSRSPTSVKPTSEA